MPDAMNPSSSIYQGLECYEGREWAGRPYAASSLYSTVLAGTGIGGASSKPFEVEGDGGADVTLDILNGGAYGNAAGPIRPVSRIV